MNINMSDIMLHIDEELNINEQSIIEAQVRSQEGVIALGYHEKRPHLMLFGFNKDVTTPKKLLSAVNDCGLHAELVGFL